MQPPTDDPRGSFTAAEVQYLIENSSSFDTDMGLEVVDVNLTVIDPNAGQWMTAATVSRNNYAKIHAAATFSLTAPLGWGVDIVRPYLTLTGPTSAAATRLTSMNFYLGAYFLDTPEEDLGETPSSFDVTGYDVLSLLDDAIGDDYAIAAGTNYLARIEEIFQGRGITKYHIDQDAAAKTAVSAKTYVMSDNPTWLQVVNDCCAAVGYQGVWTDWNGAFQIRAYTTPSLRAPEWLLTAAVENTLLTQRRRRQRDFYSAPNRWVFFQSNLTETQPVDGAGRYEYINETFGDTSVEARGRVITAPPQGVDVADQAALVAYAQRVIDADIQIPTKFAIETAPLPLAWHMDRYVVSDPVIGAQTNVLSTSWTLNLDGSDMSHEWVAL